VRPLLSPDSAFLYDPSGPITVLNKTIYDISQSGENPPDYLQLIGWVYLWAAILHWVTAILNCGLLLVAQPILHTDRLAGCDFLRFVTLFSCDTFGFYVSWVYIQYGIQVITRQFPSSSNPSSAPGETAGSLVTIILALLMLVTAFVLQGLSKTDVFHRHVRRLLVDYGMPIALIGSSAMAYWGRFNQANPPTLPVGGAFQAAGGRDWLVKFWLLEGKWVGIAFPFGVALYVLFFFDHNVSVSVSDIMCG
jgi:hypothetical protein